MTGLVIFVVVVAFAAFVQWARRSGGINDSEFSGGPDSSWHHHYGGHSDGGAHGDGGGGGGGHH